MLQNLLTWWPAQAAQYLICVVVRIPSDFPLILLRVSSGVFFLRTSFRFSADFRLNVEGFSSDFPWISVDFSLAFPNIFVEFTSGFLLIFIGFPSLPPMWRCNERDKQTINICKGVMICSIARDQRNSIGNAVL